MSYGRSEKQTNPGLRDAADAYLQAHIAEYETYKNAGNHEQAAQVAEVLKKLGHDVDPPAEKKVPEGAKERAVDNPTTEKAVENDVPPKRGPGRPPKAAEKAAD